MSIKDKRIVIIGGSSGIGLATAVAAKAAGARVTIASRSEGKLLNAKDKIGDGIETRVVSVTEDTAVEAFFADLGPVDHVVVTGSEVATGAIFDLPMEDAISSMNSKFWGPYRVARAARIRKEGSLVLVSGILSRRPQAGTVVLGAINAAVEALGRGLALELAPVRVNVVSPGLVDTPIYHNMPEELRSRFFESIAEALPAGRIGRPEDVAAAIILLMKGGYMTGTVIDVDGGGVLV